MTTLSKHFNSVGNQRPRHSKSKKGDLPSSVYMPTYITAHKNVLLFVHATAQLPMLFQTKKE